MDSTSMSPCDICGTPTRMRCQRCNSRAYCGAECQRSDWKSGHRRVCTPATSKAGSVARRFTRKDAAGADSNHEEVILIKQKAAAFMQDKGLISFFDENVAKMRR